MYFSKTKSTKRFAFQIDRNTTAKKAGSNIVTISTAPLSDGKYSSGGSSLIMTVKEARALQSFLNETLDYDPSSGPNV